MLKCKKMATKPFGNNKDQRKWMKMIASVFQHRTLSMNSQKTNIPSLTTRQVNIILHGASHKANKNKLQISKTRQR